jgi:hypothetical protein
LQTTYGTGNKLTAAAAKYKNNFGRQFYHFKGRKLRILQGNSQLDHTHGRISTPERAMMTLPHGDPKTKDRRNWVL